MIKKTLFSFAFLFTFFFLFIPNTFALENFPDIDLGSDIKETVIDCGGADDDSCNKIGMSTKVWNSMNSDYQYNNPAPLSPRGSKSFSKNQFIGPMPDGKSVLSSFVPEIMNYNYKNKSFFTYSGEKGKKYRAYMYFVSDRPLQTYTQIEGYNWIFDLYNQDNDSLLLEEYYVGYLNFDSDYEAGPNKYPYGLVFFFEFTSKSDFNEFRFYLSSDELVNIYMGNADTENSVRLSYQGFKFVETNSFILAEDTNLPDNIKDMIDKIYDSSNSISSTPSIFDDLKQCDVTDIGCHFDNLQTILKGLVNSIVSFFTTILDFIAGLLKDILTALFVPDTEYIIKQFQGLFTFFDDKLGFLTFPFEFSINFLEKFLDISNSPVKEITVPNINIGSFGTLIHGFTFNVAEYWEKPPFKQFYDIYLIFVHAFIVFGLYNLCLKKFNDMTGGSSS